MKYIYDYANTEKWARFSGDYNPVHFDLIAAEELNQTGFIAHGMRVIADIKNQVFSDFKRGFYDASMPMRLLARFEKPVLCGTEYTLQDQVVGVNKIFRIVDPSTGVAHISVSVSQADFFTHRHQECLPRTKITEEYQANASKYWPAEIGTDPVTFLSSVMFRDLCSKPNLLASNMIQESLPVNSFQELILLTRVLQTHYELRCDPVLFSRKRENLEALVFYTEKPSVTGNQNYGWIIQLQTTAKENETTLMQISVTLKVSINSKDK